MCCYKTVVFRVVACCIMLLFTAFTTCVMLQHMLLWLGNIRQNKDCKTGHEMLGTAAYVPMLPVIFLCIVLCQSCCCWHAGIEVDAMRTVAKAYQDRSLQVPHSSACCC